MAIRNMVVRRPTGRVRLSTRRPQHKRLELPNLAHPPVYGTRLESYRALSQSESLFVSVLSVGFIFLTNNPRYSGPYSVGTMEIEVPVRDPRTFSDITRHKQHILQLETVLMTVYYPSAFGSGEGKLFTGKQ